MPWAIEYTATAKSQLRTLDRQAARRILEYMDSRVAALDGPRSTGKVLTGALGGTVALPGRKLRVICDIQDHMLRVLVVRIGNRRDVYR